MDCELNTPLCKRKATRTKGPFPPKENCPATAEIKCPLAPPRCPLLPEEENDCPVSKILGAGGKGGDGGEGLGLGGRKVRCPLAEVGCPCDPTPPCPMAEVGCPCDPTPPCPMNGEIKMRNRKSKKVPCPSEFPVYQAQSINKDKTKIIPTPCAIPSSNKKQEEEPPRSSYKHVPNKVMSVESQKPGKPGNFPPKKKKKKVGSRDGLTVPDCKLSSRRPLPCSQCIDDLLESAQNATGCKTTSKDCPYLKLIDMCDEDCKCEEIPAFTTSPLCPFAPPPCPCCARKKCPITRVPACPISSRLGTEMKNKKKECRCLCPVIPLPHTLEIQPACLIHKSVKPEKIKKCPLVPDLSSSCPMESPPCTCVVPCHPNAFTGPPCEPPRGLAFGPSSDGNFSNASCAHANVFCAPAAVPYEATQLVEFIPEIHVPGHMISTLDSTLRELNKICKCDIPPPPQMVTMFPITESTFPAPSNSGPCDCTEQKSPSDCPIDCPCEPTRTFHVPTCPVKNPECLQNIPKAEKKGAQVCPFSPQCCPIGPVCPFPVAADEYSQNEKEKLKTASFKQETTVASALTTSKKSAPVEKSASPQKPKPSGPPCKTSCPPCAPCVLPCCYCSCSPCPPPSPPNPPCCNCICIPCPPPPRPPCCPYSSCPPPPCFPRPPPRLAKKPPIKTAVCPLTSIHQECPFSPNSCPLAIPSTKEPEICPFAPEPLCPLQPKPICPSTSRCLLKPPGEAPPSCPYAPPGCPMAPPKVCPPDPSENYDCPCPPCPCLSKPKCP